MRVDEVLSQHIGMPIAGVTDKTDVGYRYRAVCVPCGKKLCDLTFTQTFLEDAIDARSLAMYSIYKEVTRNACKCAWQWKYDDGTAQEVKP